MQAQEHSPGIACKNTLPHGQGTPLGFKQENSDTYIMDTLWWECWMPHVRAWRVLAEQEKVMEKPQWF